MWRRDRQGVSGNAMSALTCWVLMDMPVPMATIRLRLYTCVRMGGTLSVLLAFFQNSDTNKGFTIAQVLYLGKDGKVEKLFCFARKEGDIAEDFATIKSVDKIVPQLEKCGYKTTRTFTQYQKWFISETKMRSKAMDVFNQTVAVKDIRSLTEFIRAHMLEGGENWGERIENILNHFTQLSEAHRLLVESREQLEALQPVARLGIDYQALRSDLQQRERTERACDSFFRVKTIELFTAAKHEREREAEVLKVELEEINRQIEDTEEQIRRLQNDIENAGGERLRSLPFMIQQKEEDSKRRRERAERYRQALQKAGLQQSMVTDEESFQVVHGMLNQLRAGIRDAVAAIGRYQVGERASCSRIQDAPRESGG